MQHYTERDAQRDAERWDAIETDKQRLIAACRVHRLTDRQTAKIVKNWFLWLIGKRSALL
jgi:hypothetical protein